MITNCFSCILNVIIEKFENTGSCLSYISLNCLVLVAIDWLMIHSFVCAYVRSFIHWHLYLCQTLETKQIFASSKLRKIWN